MFLVINLSSLALPFVGGAVLQGAHSIGIYSRKRDIIGHLDLFLSRHSKDSAIKDLEMIKEKLEKYGMNKGWPHYFKFFRRPNEDLAVFREVIEEAISEAGSADDIRQIKQKVAIEATKVDEIIQKNYYRNIYQSGLYLDILSKVAYAYGLVRLAVYFKNQFEAIFFF